MVNTESSVARLSQAIRIRTVSYENADDIDAEQFSPFHRFLEDAYPTVHRILERVVVNDLSLLYTWQVADPDLAPILLMGHQDVVPVDSETEDKWNHGAFSGEIADRFVWGRGAWTKRVRLSP